MSTRDIRPEMPSPDQIERPGSGAPGAISATGLRGLLSVEKLAKASALVRVWFQPLWSHWSAPVLVRTSQRLVIAALALLFLRAAATVEIVFTVQVSYALLLAACAMAAPSILAGWLRLPSWLGWLAVGLVCSYVVALALGHPASVPSQGRASSYRGLAYLFDLLAGMAILGLMAGLWTSPDELKPLIWALAASVLAAAVYGVYQWVALRFHLPFQDVNNAVNTDGLTYGGARSQGPGPLGGQRIRSTFVEPHFLAAFLASTIPIAMIVRGRGKWRWAGGSAVLVMGFALVLTGSVPGFAAVTGASTAGLTLLWLARGRTRLASAAGVALALGAALGVTALVHPSTLSAVTGRSRLELRGAAEFRVATWNTAIGLWSERPIIGFGPGQGSVKLAQQEVVPYAPGATHVVLGTANGLWAAALLDGGIVALSFWVLMLGGLLYVGGRAVLRRPDALRVGTLVAATTATLGSMVQGDRLDLTVWVLLGLLASASTVLQPERHRGNR